MSFWHRVGVSASLAKCQLGHLESSVQRTIKRSPDLRRVQRSSIVVGHTLDPAYVSLHLEEQRLSRRTSPSLTDRQHRDRFMQTGAGQLCPHHSTCRLYEPQHPLSVGWLRWCTPVSPWTRRQRFLPFPHSSACSLRRLHRQRRILLSQMSSRTHKTTTAPSKSLQRRDTTYYFMHFDEPPRTSISNQLPDSTRHRIARELDKKPHNLTRRISIDRHLRSA